MSTDPHSPADEPRFAEFLADYFVECEEHLAIARRTLLTLESTLPHKHVDRLHLDELFRSFHTLKGLSAMVGFHEAEQLGHHLETFLGAVRRSQIELNVSDIETLMAGVVAMERVIAARRDTTTPPDVSGLVRQLASMLPAAAGQSVSSGTERQATDAPRKVNDTVIAAKISGGMAAWEIAFSPTAELSNRGVDVNAVRKKMQRVGEIVYSAPLITSTGGVEFLFVLIAPANTDVPTTLAGDGVRCVPYVSAKQDLEVGRSSTVRKPEEESSTHLTPANIVRVDLGRLDDLMRLVGELVLSRARLNEGLTRLTNAPTSEVRALRETAAIIERQLRDLREGVMRVRMVPLREVFVRMQFVVRDLIRESGKRVSVKLVGEETHIDKYVIERLMDPLLHLVRNAVSHGVESPEQRTAAGKSAEAEIQLRAKAVGETVVIEVEDDGRGMDANHILQRARARGITLGKERFDESSLLDILCVPGFSTRDTVDRASGRGIGMDVVRQTVEELGGTVRLHTVLGQGSRFEIQLPLTVSITEALIVRVGTQSYAVPQVAVQEIIPIEAGKLTHMEGNDLFRYRDRAIPIIWLSRLFDVPSDSASHHFALVIGEGTQALGLAVDRVRGLQEIVVRPLTDALVQSDAFSGATELGDGQVVLILDTSRLLRSGSKGRALPLHANHGG